MNSDGERRARLALSFLAKPGDPVLGVTLRTRTAAQVLALVTGADADGDASLADQAEGAALGRAVQRWRDRLGEIPSTARLAAWQDAGLRIIVPGDAEWPTQLDDLGDTRPLLLWLCGTADLRLACINSVAIVGSRAATGYGQHVAIEMAAVLAEKDIGVISGGAYGTLSQLAIGLVWWLVLARTSHRLFRLRDHLADPPGRVAGVSMAVPRRQGVRLVRRATYRVLNRIRADVREVIALASSTAAMPTGRCSDGTSRLTRPHAADVRLRIPFRPRAGWRRS